MAFWDSLTRILALEPWHEPLHTRDTPTEDGSLADFMARIQGARTQVWHAASVNEALGVPAIFRAVTLISNVVGSLSMRAFRNGAELAPEDRPRLVVRPNPFTTPREFYRESAWSMAAYGEAWWWIAARDTDDMPLSLIPVHPREVIVTDNRRDPRYPIIEWRGKTMPNADMVQIKMTGETGALRGKGPLQMCGAAASVSVEAQEWAANFFAEDGGTPSLIIKSATPLGEGEDGVKEAETLRDQWMSKPHNTPRVIDPDIDSVQEFAVDQQAAQMMQARNVQNGEAARMFGIPGPLLEYVTQGSSLTYQNVGQEFAKLTRVCLLPDYLEPMEQAMSDQLTRSITSRFNVEALERADIKTLYEVAALGFEKGITDQSEARATVGLSPSIETAAVPVSPPQAVPTVLPFLRSWPEPREVHCQGTIVLQGRVRDCNRLLGKLVAPYEVVCPRCKSVAAAA